MRRLTTIPLLPLLLARCDTDGDLLPSSSEREYGTDPRTADTDNDGLDDLTEVNWSLTDPLDADTDDDGDEDGFEITYGLDPLDDESHGYDDLWPMATLATKSAIREPSVGATLKIGEVIPRFQAIGGTGETVDLYDFAGHGQPILFGGGTETGAGIANAWIPRSFAGQTTPPIPIRDHVEAGSVLFAALATHKDSVSSEPPAPASSNRWCQNEPRQCLSEPTLAMWNWTGQHPMEMWIVLDEHMVVRATAKRDPETLVMDFSELNATIEALLAEP